MFSAESGIMPSMKILQPNLMVMMYNMLIGLQSNFLNSININHKKVKIRICFKP